MAARAARATGLLSAPSASGALALGVLAPAFVALAAWSWGTWPDVLVDFGRECYAPWRLAQGDVLYRDLAWFNGPLSPYFNALIFALAGASLRALFLANLALFALALWLLWRLLARASTSLAATAACLVVMGLCGFGQLVGIGNYNFVAPYSHEVTHGLVCALAALALLERAHERESTLAWAGAGLCVGLVWLTKVEMALAASVAVALRVALARRARAAALVAGAALVPSALALVALSGALGWGEAWRGTTAAWRSLAASEAAGLAFYRQGAGLDAPGANTARLLFVAAGWLGVAGAIALSSFALRATPLARGRGPWICAALACAGLWLCRGQVHWLGLARPLPLAVLLFFATGWVARRDPARRRAAHARLALAALAFVLLLKMLLNARVEQYGFALAAPALALSVTLAVGDLPAWVERLGASGAIARALSLAGCAVVIAAHLELGQARLARKTVAVGSGGDRFLADVRGEYLNRALELLAREPPGATLAVFPEGVMANYLARRRNPTPYVNFMPPELLLFGEARIVAAFRAAPADRAWLVHKDTSEYGFPLFGADYGRELASWIVSQYQPLGPPLGDPPLTPGARFGIQVLGR